MNVTAAEARAEIARRKVKRAAACELALRREARQDMAGWFEYGPPTILGSPKLYRWQRDLLARLQRLFDEWDALPPEPRPVWIVSVDAPPQTGKSEDVKRAIAYSMARYGMSWGYASYVASLAVTHSVEVRSFLRSPEARRLWPWLGGGSGRADETTRDNQDAWGIPSPSKDRRGARFIARGRDGALTGEPMDGICLDDMYKSAGDYSSTAARTEVDQFLRSAAIARLLERGGIILNVGTRWGLADTHAWFERLIEEQRGAGLSPRYEVWSYPLRAREGDVMGRAPGEYLSERWDEAKEAAARIFYGRHACAILDGAPVPEGGARFKTEWFDRRYPGTPEAMARQCDVRVLSVDPASTEGGGDHSVIDHVGWCGVKQRLLGKDRGQWGYTTLRQRIRDRIAEHRPHYVLVEKSSSGIDVINELEREFPNIVPIPTTNRPKGVRWDTQAGVFYAGNMEFPESAVAPWMPAFVDRMVVLTGDPKAREVDDDADAWEIATRWRSTSALAVVRRSAIPGM